MDKALFADSIATSVGAIFGTSNTTTFVKVPPALAPAARGPHQLRHRPVLFDCHCAFACCRRHSPLRPRRRALIVVGCMMLSAFKEIKWEDFSEAVPPSSQAFSRPCAIPSATALRPASSSLHHQSGEERSAQHPPHSVGGHRSVRAELHHPGHSVSKYSIAQPAPTAARAVFFCAG